LRASHHGTGKTIVTILADYGTRYQSKLFNAGFLRSKGLPVPWWLARKEHAQPAFVEVETA
jgi:cysteine synthase A